jgi:hypothetical protein
VLRDEEDGESVTAVATHVSPITRVSGLCAEFDRDRICASRSAAADPGNAIRLAYNGSYTHLSCRELARHRILEGIAQRHCRASPTCRDG